MQKLGPPRVASFDKHELCGEDASSGHGRADRNARPELFLLFFFFPFFFSFFFSTARATGLNEVNVDRVIPRRDVGGRVGGRGEGGGKGGSKDEEGVFN